MTNGPSTPDDPAQPHGPPAPQGSPAPQGFPAPQGSPAPRGAFSRHGPFAPHSPFAGDGDEDPDEPPDTARVRTRLSWWRTFLTITGILLLTLRVALRLDDAWAGALVGTLSVLCWLGLLAVCRKRIIAMAGHPPAPAGPTPAVLALGIAGFAILGIVAVVLL